MMQQREKLCGQPYILDYRLFTLQDGKSSMHIPKKNSLQAWKTNHNLNLPFRLDLPDSFSCELKIKA